MKKKQYFISLLLLVALNPLFLSKSGASDTVQHRVIISTDIGGIDPDDL